MRFTLFRSSPTHGLFAALALTLGSGCSSGGGGSPSVATDAAIDGDGGGSPPGDVSPGGDVATGGCKYTVTGAATASGTCDFSAAYGMKTNELGFAFRGMVANTVQFGGGAPGQRMLTAGTYTLAQIPQAGGFYIQGGGTQVWEMCNNNACTAEMKPVPNHGTFTLVISDPGAALGGLLWKSPHGTLHMDLPAVPGSAATGTVAVDATF